MRAVLRRYEKYYYIMPTIIFLMIFLLVPLVNMFRYSFMDVSLIGGEKGFVGLKNYKVLLTPKFLSTLYRTVIWLVGGMLGMMFFGSVIAFSLKESTTFNRIFSVIVMIPWVIPEAFAAIMWSWLLNVYYGFINNFLLYFNIIEQPISFFSASNALLTVIIVRIWKGTPFMIMNLIAALKTTPKDIEEAAQIDGANYLQKLWYIVFPHIRPVFIVTSLILASWTLQMFDTIFILTGGGPVNATEIISIGIYNSAFIDKNIGVACALAVFTMALVLLISIPTFTQERGREL